MQIVQELCRRPGLNKCGFEMPTIYIPNPQKVLLFLFTLSKDLKMLYESIIALNHNVL